MSILVTGGAGYIGSHMVLELLDNGEKPIILDNMSAGFGRPLPYGAALVLGDMADQELIIKTIEEHNVTAIIHFAGSTDLPKSISNPLDYYLNNVDKSRALKATAVKCGIDKFIFSSSASVYGKPDTSPVFEDAPLDPISPYGSSKLMTEIMLRDTAIAHNFNYVVLRYFNVAGADPKGRSGQSSRRATHLIKVASQAAIGERTHVDVYGTDYATNDGTCIRDYFHVSDLVNIHSHALAYLKSGGTSQVFNCGYGRGYSVLEVINAVKNVSGTDFPVYLKDRRPSDPPELIAGTVE